MIVNVIIKYGLAIRKESSTAAMMPPRKAVVPVRLAFWNPSMIQTGVSMKSRSSFSGH